MNSEKKNNLETAEQSTKKYCDRSFKVQLAKSLKANGAEPENFTKICS